MQAPVENSATTHQHRQSDINAATSGHEHPGTSAARSRNVSHVRYCDVTETFSRASAAIHRGILIQDEGFSLLDAVSALEIGDAKMDGGVIEQNESFEHVYDVTRSLEAGEVIWLMDELSCLEVAWLSGYPLSQTLLTSVYIDRLLWPEPENIGEARFAHRLDPNDGQSQLNCVLQSFCIALIKCCDCVHKMVTSQHYFEEEDFASQLFHRELLRNVPVAEAIKAVHERLSWLSDSQLAKNARRGLSTRLRLRLLVLQTLVENGQNPLCPLSDTSSFRSVLDSVHETRSLGIPVSDSFSWKIQRTLASSFPPRPLIRGSYGDVATYVQDFFLHSKLVRNFFAIDSGSELMVAYRLYTFQGNQQSVYVRALLQSLIFQEGKLFKDLDIHDIVVSDICKLVLPGSSPILMDFKDGKVSADDGMQLSQAMENFINKLGSSFSNLIRVQCLNRCRLRRSLCHAIVEWDQMQADAEGIDSLVHELFYEQPTQYPEGGALTHSYPLSSWIYHYKLVQMEFLVQMGFELRVYAVDEMHQMYWYLSHICSIHLDHLDRIGFFIRRHRGRIKTQNDQKTIETEVDRTFRYLSRIFNSIKATEALARALHKLYLVIWRHSRSRYRQRKKPYSSDHMRYQLRTRPLLSVSVPEAISFEDFQSMSATERVPDQELLEESSKYLALAKKGWDEARKKGWKEPPIRGVTSQATEGFFDKLWSQDVTRILKACIGTGVAIATVSKRLAAQQSPHLQHQPDLRFEIAAPGEHDCWHNWWVVPRMLE